MAKATAQPGNGLWDQPALLNLVSDLLLLFSSAVFAYGAATLVQRLPAFSLHHVVVRGDLRQVTRTQIEYAVSGAATGNFFTVSLGEVRTAFEKLPWVRRADVRRRWPDALELNIEEHAAVVRWRQPDGEARLVDAHGEVFPAASEHNLPVFMGPDGSAPQVLARYREFNAALRPLGRHLASVTLSPRQAWQLTLDNGMVVELGREDSRHPVSERMARFVASYPEAARQAGAPLAAIDMRYPNGFAMRVANNKNSGKS